MENKNGTDFSRYEDYDGGSRKRIIRILIALLAIVLVILLVCAVEQSIIQNKNHPQKQQNQNTYNFDAHFPGCTPVSANCLDQSCAQYLYCNDKAYVICRIYDCKDSFGVGTQDKSGKIDIKTHAKLDTEKTSKTIADCQGDLVVLENKCVDQKMQLKVQVGTAGDCAVNNFMVFYKGLGFRTSSFSSAGDNQYVITSDYCNDLDKVVAVGEGGTTIKEKNF